MDRGYSPPHPQLRSTFVLIFFSLFTIFTRQQEDREFSQIVTMCPSLRQPTIPIESSVGYIYIYVYVRGSFVINISIFIYDRFFTYNLIKALLVVRKEIIDDGEKDEDGERKIRL